MVRRGGEPGSIRFLSQEYHQAVNALKGQAQTGSTLITLSGASQPELARGAEQVARTLGRSLYRVPLSQVVSKYIGETEKNLDRALAEAGRSSAVLVFEDGDALFGGGSASSGTNQASTRVLEKVAAHRGIIIALLKQPPPPAPHRRIRHIHLKFPPA